MQCSRRRLLRRELEFHVCTINKSAHTKKSLETYLMILVYIYCPVSWSSRIHRLHLYKGVRSLANECLIYDTKQTGGEVPVMLWLLKMRSMPSLPLFPGPLLTGVVVPDRVRAMGQIEVNCVLMLNCIAWNRTVLTFKLHSNAKLNFLKWNCFCLLNWIVGIELFLTLKLFLHYTELFEIELFWHLTGCKQKLYSW